MASGNDMDSARETYSGFTALVKWSAICAGLATAVVVFLIA